MNMIAPTRLLIAEPFAPAVCFDMRGKAFAHAAVLSGYTIHDIIQGGNARLMKTVEILLPGGGESLRNLLSAVAKRTLLVIESFFCVITFTLSTGPCGATCRSVVTFQLAVIILFYR